MGTYVEVCLVVEGVFTVMCRFRAAEVSNVRYTK